ncbi:hypothetical protein [Weissella cibaria]|nr:hypothetical protein H3N00_11535 [Weissella cibaria]
MNQSYRNWKLIIIDDSPPDASFDITWHNPKK